MRTVFAVIFILFVNTLFAQNIVEAGASWRYFKGTQNPSEGTEWIKVDFDDSNWSEGLAPFRYGDGTGGTVLNDMYENYSSLYLRKTIEYNAGDSISFIEVEADYDDGFQLWINGNVVLSFNYPNNADFDCFASGSHESGTMARFRIDPLKCKLKHGTNQLAVHGLNVKNSSSDFYFDMSLYVKALLPVAEERPTVDLSSGFYDEPFSATISLKNAGDTVIYTIDGTDPRNSVTAKNGVTPLIVSVNPTSLERSCNSPVFLLQACKVQQGYDYSLPLVASYIFPEEVLKQDYPGGKWPNTKINNHVYDYKMDPDVVNSNIYKSQVIPALFDIPSVSIVTDPGNLFDAGSGIWVNPKERGKEWEREASFEIISRDSIGTGPINCGIRIRGGASRNANNPKHALRIFFRDEYGTSKLKYPLFGAEGVDEFEKVDLRTSQNYAWSRTGNDGWYNTMVREVFSRDLQKEMGNLYTRSRYYHLYLNGMYWGIYQSQERSEARFAESYLGRDNDDYDVIKVDGTVVGNRVIEATDGTMDVWEQVWNRTKNGFQNNTNYFDLLGLDATGNIDPEGMCYIDVANLIDYMLVIFYTGNYDSPTNVWTGNKGVNNFYAIKNRNRKHHGFVFLQHDAEHSLFYDQLNVGTGIMENRVNVGFLNNDMKMEVDEFRYFQPQYLHHKLMKNSEYRQLFIDRVYKWFYKEKLLQKEKSVDILMDRASQIDKAIIAESARWGDARMSTPRTRDNDWAKAIDQITGKYFDERPAIVLSQIRDVNWYTAFGAPEYYVGSLLIDDRFLYLGKGDLFVIKNPDNQGDIYYTLDGTDPRTVGGGISSSAFTQSGNIELEFNGTTIVKSRIKNGSEWSAINEISLLGNDNLNDLILSEIHYHPLETPYIKSKNLEFVEFKNTSEYSLNLSGVSIWGGINYDFPEGTVVPAGQFVVIASNAIEFRERYAVDATGEFSGHLSNGSDTLNISQANQVLYSIVYSDESPWPVEADGYGNSIVYNEEIPSVSPEIAAYWRASHAIGGTPFGDDYRTDADDVLMAQGVNDIEVYPNPAHNFINVRFSTVKNGVVNLRLLNCWGQEVAVLISNKSINADGYTEFVDLQRFGLTSGIYILQLSVDGVVTNNKIAVH